MDKGISPVITVVLLIAISMVTTIGVWYWMGEVGAKPEGMEHDEMEILVEDCDPEYDQIKVRNTGGIPVTVDLSIYLSDGGEVGTLELEKHRLDSQEVRYFLADMDDGETLKDGEEYEIIGRVPTVSFICEEN